MLLCFKGYSLIKEFYDKGSTGGVASTLAFCILEMKLAQGIICLDHCFPDPHWFVAYNKAGILRAAGSTYEYVKFDIPVGNCNLAQIGKPCDLAAGFSPKISLFCSHSYRRKKIPITKQYAGLSKSKIRTVLENPIPCFLCSDHIGVSSDISVGDTQTDPEINVVLVHSKLGEQLLGYTINHKYLLLEKIKIEDIKQKQPYLWRFRK